MKSALQEAEEASDEPGEKANVLDAKGREVISPEERARREEKERVKAEKDRQKAAEVRFCFFPFFSFMTVLLESSCPCREGIQTCRKPRT